MTAIQLAPPPAPRRPHRTDWQGVRDAIELFILERRADKKQPSTIRYYRQQLGLFCAWLTHQDVPGDGPEDVTKALILAYRLHLQERGHTRLAGQPLQHPTLVASQRALRTFVAWAEEPPRRLRQFWFQGRSSGAARRSGARRRLASAAIRSFFVRG